MEPDEEERARRLLQDMRRSEAVAWKLMACLLLVTMGLAIVGGSLIVARFGPFR